MISPTVFNLQCQKASNKARKQIPNSTFYVLMFLAQQHLFTQQENLYIANSKNFPFNYSNCACRIFFSRYRLTAYSIMYAILSFTSKTRQEIVTQLLRFKELIFNYIIITINTCIMHVTIIQRKVACKMLFLYSYLLYHAVRGVWKIQP